LAQADALQFLEHDDRRYGLIHVDPPTFSNSKRAADFDVQRDHVRLLARCAAHLAPNGVIIFSNNFRRFKLDIDALSRYFDVTDWSQPSIPFDFARHANHHGCWLLRR
jgi:23S rRNA (guanine2445-N2)-methyltransferase / 23S rRNA (guanine2069-N7)-methyltransferase